VSNLGQAGPAPSRLRDLVSFTAEKAATLPAEGFDLKAGPGGNLRVLRRLRAFKGASAPARRLILSVLATTVGALAFTAAPALAAAPEAPVTEAPSPIAGTTATFKGELIPGATTEKVSYHFAYSPGPGAMCTESGLTAPAEPFPEAEDDHTKITQAVAGLEAQTEYTVCLIAANPAEPAESNVGSSETFTTLASKPVVVTQSTSSVTPFAATLQAEVNPENQTTTSCTFEYGKVITEHKTPCEQATLEGGSPELATLTVSGLKSASAYHYRVVVKNATGEVKGTGTAAEEEFTTLTAEAPIVEGESAPAPKAAEARLEAVVNANYQEVTKCEFRYGTSPSLATSTTVDCEPATLEGLYGPQGVGVSVTGLAPETIYYYRVVARNATGPVEGAIEHFTTGPPGQPEAKPANPVTGTTATLNGVLNLGQEGNPGSYEFIYRESKTACQGVGETAAGGGASGGKEEAVAAELAGLLPKHTYTFCLLAHNEAGEPSVLSTPVTFETGVVASSQVETTGAAMVTATSAVLTGELNPGGEAAYYFEYGTAPCDEVAATCGMATAESAPVTGETELPVSPTSVTGLQPATLYHYWLVVKNALGAVHSAPSEFRTVATQAEVEAEEAAGRKPAEEAAAAAAAVSRREAEAANGQAAAAVVAAAEKKKYEELAVETTALLTPKLLPATVPPKATAPKVVRCKKGFAKKHNKCVRHERRKKYGVAKKKQ
jgi:hypothetical protein